MFACLADVRAEEARVSVEADQVVGQVTRHLTGACIEDVNHEIYGGIYSQMIFGESFQEPSPAAQGDANLKISGMWRAVRSGTAKGKFALVTEKPFIGKQSQLITFASGEGQWGIENQGLNRWGMGYVAGKPYEGYVFVRAEKPAKLYAVMESRDGTKRYAEIALEVPSGDWRRIDFRLTPNATDKAGRYSFKLKQPGTVEIGYAFLQPGEWGRFEGLPVRRDVALGLIDQGITVLRYGGSMINHPEYNGRKWSARATGVRLRRARGIPIPRTAGPFPTSWISARRRASNTFPPST